MHRTAVNSGCSASRLRHSPARIYVGAAAVAHLVGLVGCHNPPAVADNAIVIVEPGRGVTNRCEIGMTFAQIKQANPEATSHGIRDNSWTLNRWRGGRFALVASLGAIASLGTNQPISHIEFYVVPHKEAFIPGLEVDVPFRGRLGDKLSFHEGPITKDDLQSRYGVISVGTTNASDTFQFQVRGERFWWRLEREEEELWYTDQGVAFVLKSNRVTSFKIFKPRGNN